MVKIKYSGAGIFTRGQRFTKDPNALYTVSKEDAEYLVKTFKGSFIKIENAPKKPVKTEVKKTTKIKES